MGGKRMGGKRGWEGRGWEGSGWEGSGWEGRGWEGRGWEGRGWEGRGWEGRGWEGSGAREAFWLLATFVSRSPPGSEGTLRGFPLPLGALPQTQFLRSPRSQGPKCATPSLQTALEWFHIRCTREVSGSPKAHLCRREGDGRPRRGERLREEPGAGALGAASPVCKASALRPQEPWPPGF